MDDVYRFMYFGEFSDEFESETKLIPPLGIFSAKNSDTRLWNVDNSVILNDYIATMIIFPFVFGSLNHLTSADKFLQSDHLELTKTVKRTKADVLIIGLGGGTLDMFLYTRMNSLNITVIEKEELVKHLAMKWFGVVDDERRRTIVMDAEQIANSTSLIRNGKSELFDAIFIDACDSTNGCPAAKFTNFRFLQNIKKMLKPLGSLVLNVLPYQRRSTNNFSIIKKEDGISNDIRKVLVHNFPLCLSAKMQIHLNSVLACTQYSIDISSLSDEKAIWEERYNQTRKVFGFEKLLSETFNAVVVNLDVQGIS